MRYPGFCLETYPARSFAVSIDRTVNWYPEIVESKLGKSLVNYYPTPGLTLIADTSALGTGRGAFSIDGRMFAVIGRYLVEFDVYGNYAKHPGDADPNPVYLADDGNPVTIVANSKTPPQLFITSAGKGYIYDLSTNALSEITGGVIDPGGTNTPGKFLGASMGAFLDGYFIALTPDSRGFQISQINDGFTWAADDIQLNNASADKVRAIITDHEYLYLAGSKRMAVYANTGPQPTSDFPINPVPGAFVEQGIRAPHSFKRIDNTLMFYGENEDGGGSVYRMEGFIPKRVSTHAEEQIWAQFGLDTDAIGFNQVRGGHTFYRLTFPAQDMTFVYDLATDKWHERASWDAALGQYHAQIQRFQCYATGGSYGKYFVIGADGRIYKEDDGVYTDAGKPIRRVRIPPVIAKENKMVFVTRLEVVIEPGIGLDGDPAAQGANPRMMLRYSPDSGKTWSGELMERAGRSGEYGARVVFDRLGSGRAWVPEVSVTDPVNWVIVDANIEFEVGAW